MNKFSAKDIAYVGVAAASLTAVKFALSWLANIELLSLFLVFYTLKLGKNKTILACNVFIVVEIFLYGFGAWVISYFLHWNAVVLVAWALDRKGVKKSIFWALCIASLTVLFGVQSTAVEVLLYSSGANFFYSFGLKYFMGLSFFITHIVSSFLSIALLLPPLSKIPIGDREKVIKF